MIMKNIKFYAVSLIAASVIFSSCSTWQNANNRERGSVVGAGAGAAVGAGIGAAAKNPALGAVLGAVVGGVAGNVIGRKMDKQAEEIKNQIPDAKVERVEEGIVVEFNSNVLFGFDKSDLTSGSRSTLNDLITILNKYPDTNLEIAGHTDSKGAENYNQRLSERRAGSVSSYLESNGVSGRRITTKGYGETAPKYDNSTESGRAQNRRVEFMITANEKMKNDAHSEARKG